MRREIMEHYNIGAAVRWLVLPTNSAETLDFGVVISDNI